MACVFAYAIYSGMPSRLGLSRHVTAYGTPGISFSDPPDRHLVAPGAHSVPFNASRLSMMALHQLALQHSPAALISSPQPGRGFHTRTFILGLVTCVCLAVTEAPAQDTAPASDPVLYPATVPSDITYELQPAFLGMTFAVPVDLQHAKGLPDHLFIVERRGLIHAVVSNSSAARRSVFLNLTDQVHTAHHEEGLLGVAFHPDYVRTRTFYVYHSACCPRRTVVARYQSTPDNLLRADPSSRTVLLTIPQPDGRHNGGQLQFGPDGYLHISVGDGGPGGDPHREGQNRRSLLGTILRIDVDPSSAPSSEDPSRTKEVGRTARPYGIPADNPFAGNTKGFREEIFAYGFRNPWRFSIDPATGQVWVGDVGQSGYEEINRVHNGGNYGWSKMEGPDCFRRIRRLIGCLSAKLSRPEEPVWAYRHDDGISVTGGYVYRGPDLPHLVGRYIYGDWGSGKIWALGAMRTQADEPGVGSRNEFFPQNQLLIDTDHNITAFGTDAAGRLYVCTHAGQVFRLTAAEGRPPDITRRRYFR